MVALPESKNKTIYKIVIVIASPLDSSRRKSTKWKSNRSKEISGSYKYSANMNLQEEMKKKCLVTSRRHTTSHSVHQY